MNRTLGFRLVRVLASAAIAASSAACAMPYAAGVRDDAQAIERERNPEKLMAAGDAWMSVGDWARAAQYLELAIACGGPENEIFPKLLGALIRDKQYRGATIAAENHLRLHPTDTAARLVLGSLYASLGEGASARKEYETILRREPDNADAHYSLAVILRGDQKDPLGADQHFREYLRVAPQGVHAEQARGLLLETVQ
jgi:tetratricopeptide (TPR) repeat protein